MGYIGSLWRRSGRFRLALIALLLVPLFEGAAQQQVAPTISVTVNKSMVFRLAERAKRVSVSQPAGGGRNCRRSQPTSDQRKGMSVPHR